jgi:rhamnose utilization protein RhaD (predicted bifunctional aldolase and dehydrogenase)
MQLYIQQLIELSQYAALRTDWIQGPGGNTSVKMPGGAMLVKASGGLLKDVDAANGWVQVQTSGILHALTAEDGLPGDAQHLERVNAAVMAAVAHSAQPGLRPSMETAFHTLFHTCVLHTHNVYANAWLCSSRFEEIEYCFTGDEPYAISLLKDYYTPGAELSWWLWQCYRFEEAMPNVVLMPNHGIIISAPTVAEVIEIHEDVQQRLCRFLKLQESDYPVFTTAPVENGYRVHSAFLADCLREERMRKRLFEEFLFPDQVIYLNGREFSDTDAGAAVYFEQDNGTIMLRKTGKEADTIAELMTAVCWLYRQMDERGWEPLTINYDAPKLLGMNSEQYRRERLRGGGVEGN